MNAEKPWQHVCADRTVAIMFAIDAAAAHTFRVLSQRHGGDIVTADAANDTIAANVARQELMAAAFREFADRMRPPAL